MTIKEVRVFTFKGVSIAAALSLLLACSSPEDGETSSHQVVPVSVAGEAGRPRAVGETRAEAKSAKANPPSSWKEFVSRQVPDDQLYLEALDQRYFGALSYSDAEERAYVTRAGFPTPEEWLAARTMPIDELRGQADKGDPKAAGMYADRMAMELKALVALHGRDPAKVSDADRMRAATQALWYADQAANRRPGFGNFVNGMVKSTMYKTWEPMTAAILYSMGEGDPRADRLAAEMYARQPTQDISLLHSSLKRMRGHRK